MKCKLKGECTDDDEDNLFRNDCQKEMEEVSLDFGQLGEACSRNMELLVSEQSSLLEQASKVLLQEETEGLQNQKKQQNRVAMEDATVDEEKKVVNFCLSNSS